MSRIVEYGQKVLVLPMDMLDPTYIIIIQFYLRFSKYTYKYYRYIVLI